MILGPESPSSRFAENWPAGRRVYLQRKVSAASLSLGGRRRPLRLRAPAAARSLPAVHARAVGVLWPGVADRPRAFTTAIVPAETAVADEEGLCWSRTCGPSSSCAGRTIPFEDEQFVRTASPAGRGPKTYELKRVGAAGSPVATRFAKVLTMRWEVAL